MRPGRARLVAAAAAIALTAGAVLAAAPARGVDYPSWDEVEAARSDAAATAATIETLTAALDDLQAEAARLGDVAVTLQGEADAAQAALEVAGTRAATLDRRADAAAARTARSATRAAQIAAALYRSGGLDGSTTLLLTGDSTDLLGTLSSLNRVGGTVAQLLTEASFDRNEAEAIAAQAATARAERDRLARTATSAADSARAAVDAANAAVAQQQSKLSVVYEQLAALKNTSAELERQYRIGQESGDEPAAGGGSGGGGSDGGGSDGGGFSPPGSEVNNPAAAKAFAAAQLAARGHDAGQNYCLVLLWNRESGWRTNAYNASSGAYGIPQSLPGSKMGNYAADWRTNYETQVMWGIIYIESRYGSPCRAWDHSEEVGWY